MGNRLSFCFFLVFFPWIAWGSNLPPVGEVQSPAGVVAAQERTQQGAVGQSPGKVAKEAHSSGLTADLVYAVLAGQVAGQRGEHEAAFAHFLQGARLARNAGVMELAADAALALDDPEAVQQIADVWLELSPDSIAAHQLAAYARLETDDVPVATEHLRRIIALAAEQGGDGYGHAAHLVSQLKLPDRRLKLMEILTAEEPENADAWFARAVVAAGADGHEEALEAAQRASDLRPDWNLPRIFLVQQLLGRGDREQARRFLETFVNENPDDQGLRLLYAQLLVDEQEFSRARSLFEQILSNAPKAPDVLFALGVLSLELKEPDAARDYFVQLHDTGERRSDSAFYLGQVEELTGNPESAVSWYRDVEDKHVIDARIRIALIRAEQGEVERAREIFQQVRDQWPENAPMLYLVEGAALTELDRLQEAMEVYDRALEAFPGDHELLYARGLHAVALDRLDIMERDLQAILAADPDNADALNALGYSLADRTERFTEALTYIERALALKPDDPAVLDSMGWVRFRLGEPEAALDYLQQASALTADGEIAGHLGEVLWALGRHDEAREVWEAALDQDPDHEYLLRLIGRHRITRSDSRP